MSSPQGLALAVGLALLAWVGISYSTPVAADTVPRSALEDQDEARARRRITAALQEGLKPGPVEHTPARVARVPATMAAPVEASGETYAVPNTNVEQGPVKLEPMTNETEMDEWPTFG
jgi:hypothetical protein